MNDLNTHSKLDFRRIVQRISDFPILKISFKLVKFMLE